MKPGTRVEILTTHETGTLINPRRIKTTPRGVPLIKNHYKPANWKREAPVRLDHTHEFVTVFRGSLRAI